MISRAKFFIRPTNQKWVVLLIASGGLFLSFLDVSVNVALPNITDGFGTSLETIHWIIILYVGTATSLQLSLGSVADNYGLKRVYTIGILIYTLAVLCIGLAPNLSSVFALRIFQAVGTGLMAASVPALITRAFPEQERGRALGLMAGLAATGMIVGAIGSGFLTDIFGWRSVFLARVPIGIAFVLLTTFFLLQGSEQVSTKPRFAFLGSLTLVVSIMSFIIFLALGGRTGWSKVEVLILASISIVSLGIFVYFERAAERPLMDPKMLKNKVLVSSTIIAYLMNLSVFLNWFILPFYVTNILGGDAKTLGLMFALTAGSVALAAPIGGWLSDRTSPAYVSTGALLILTGTLAWFSTLDISSTLTDVMIRSSLIGLGIGLFQASNASIIMGSAPRRRLGSGASLIEFARNMGIVSSVAVLGAVFSARLALHSASSTADFGLLETAMGQTFVRAFRDTYLISTSLAATAVLGSLFYWLWRPSIIDPSSCRR